jgi:predicted ATP-grasp superfamily ATP-dependent carboligase
MLAAIRSLSAAGFSVTAVATAPSAPGLWSRACRERHLAPDPGRDVRGFIQRLDEILSRRRHAILLAGSDVSLLAISRYRERLAGHLDLDLPTRDVVESVLAKDRLTEPASRVGLAPPEGLVCSDIEHAVRAARGFGYPVLIKPGDTVADRNGGLHRRASVLAHDEAVVISAASVFGRCIVQRRVQGQVVSFAGVATPAGLLSFVVSRYARTWPPEAGNALFSETIAAPPGLAAKVQSLVAELGWSGLFELELIERGEGDLAAIDFNPRAYGSMSLARAAGVPLPALWCRWLLGMQPQPAVPRLGVRYRREDAEAKYALWQLRHRNPRLATMVLVPRRHVAHAYFEARDPAPLLASALELSRTAAGGIRAKR